ncbi:MAG: Hpt domain-containing protein [Magnetococcus sp. DMHC-8]
MNTGQPGGAMPATPPDSVQATGNGEHQPADGHHLLDFARLAEMRQELGEHFLMVIQHFQAGMLTRPARIQQAFQTGQAEEMAMETHSFKGACKQLGLFQLGSVASALESIVRTGTLSEAGPLVEQLRASGVLVHRALQQYCLTLARPAPSFEKSVDSATRE